MKFLALLFLVGVAVAAPFHDELDQAADEIVSEFMASMELSPFLMAADEGEEDIKTELGKKLRETLDHILEKMKEAIDKGKTVKEDLLEKFKDVKEKLKDLHIEVSDKAKDLYQKIKDHVKDWLKKFLEKIGIDEGKEERSVDDLVARSIVESLKEKFRKLREIIEEKFDPEALKIKIEEIFGKNNDFGRRIKDLIKEGKDKVKDFIDRFLGKDGSSREERSLQELWEKVRDYFKNLKIEIKEKYAKFGDWVKNTFGDKLEEGKSKLENMKKIAEEYIERIKDMEKDVASEGMEFLNQFKKDLGDLWDKVAQKFKEKMQKQD